MKFAENIKRAFSMTGFKLRVHSPEILVVTGVVGTVVGTVMACKATMKLDEILAEANDNIDRVKKAAEDEALKEKYTEDDRKKDLAIVYVKTGVKVAKLHAPAALVMTASIVSVLTGHSVLRKRNLALAAAYATVDKGYKEYRKGVIDKFGEELDRELKHGVKAVELADTVTDEKTGEPKEVSKTVEAIDPNRLPNEYSRIFDERNRNWDNAGPKYSKWFLQAQQQYANDLLRAQGYLTLNEVYEMLGFEKTRAGQVVGWVYDKKNPVGDNFVDFGIHEVRTPVETSDYIEDWGNAYILDFNVDGNILDRANW